MVGYVGPLCEECDYNNIRGDGHYAFEQHECKLCSDLFNKIIRSLFIVTFLLLITNLIIRNIEN